MRGAGASNSGISDIPMQLLIGACILTFAAPVFTSAYGDLSEKLTINRMDGSVQDLVEGMEEVLSGSHGSRISVDVDIGGFGSCRLEELRIGGPPDEGSERYMVRYSLSTGFDRLLSLDPPYPISTPEGLSLKLGPGDYTVVITRPATLENECLILELE